ncbi:uncharacterized protein EI97DRAFT_499924 [Westerdykella ornata]|uniref:Ureidoglycolate hydrolase n=1 Tax=Westerdykella ornata TaxID=318751 RepID=A0A6A6JPC9_WESOR|nr:uncharacterized protein EI97DRAFT_499924 [Westerdykella ornata]KAF2278510.1 hypothetical protein EI97DRAFT_499924 [Westerdykella ornata]
MPPSIPAPSIRVPIESLSQPSFSQFGTVIQNPAHTAPSRQPPPQETPKPESANQGTALKFLDVTLPTNLYHLAPSRRPARPVVNMFVCAPRDLRPHEPSSSMPSSWGDIDLDDDDEEEEEEGGGASGLAGLRGGSKRRDLFDVHILERHPYTTQTFIPMGLGVNEKHTQYLVIVAPTLPASQSHSHDRKDLRPPPYPLPSRPKKRNSLKDIFARARPSPYTNSTSPPSTTTTPHASSSLAPLHPSQRPKGPGLPDLRNIRAFIANGTQAVTYGPGTWHAPMVVIGDRPIDFVVVQFANGVGGEDCQEVVLKKGEGKEEGVVVCVDRDWGGRVVVKAGPGARRVRAKLIQSLVPSAQTLPSRPLANMNDDSGTTT